MGQNGDIRIRVETKLRLDRVRRFSERLRSLSGYELEPYKPLVGENLFRRESGAVASQMDKNVAYLEANNVPDVFSVTNKLRVER